MISWMELVGLINIRETNEMKRWLVIIVTSVSCGIYANQLVDAALTSTVINGCLASRRMELHVKGWGVPERLFSEPAFTNLDCRGQTPGGLSVRHKETSGENDSCYAAGAVFGMLCRTRINHK